MAEAPTAPVAAESRGAALASVSAEVPGAATAPGEAEVPGAATAPGEAEAPGMATGSQAVEIPDGIGVDYECFPNDVMGVSDDDMVDYEPNSDSD